MTDTEYQRTPLHVCTENVKKRARYGRINYIPVRSYITTTMFEISFLFLIAILYLMCGKMIKLLLQLTAVLAILHATALAGTQY